MSFLDALVHVLNFLTPAAGVALIAAALAKLLWRKALAGVPFLRLVMWPALACAACLVGGIVIVGRDGHMGTYASMVVANALTLWWAGFVRGPRR